MKKTYETPSIEKNEFSVQQLILSDSQTYFHINPVPDDNTVESEPFNGE